MIKRILPFLICVFLLSCEKVAIEPEQPTTDPQAVVFTVGSIEQVDFENTLSRASLPELCSRISFAVFKDEDKIKSANQVSTDNVFGTFSLNLAEGTYHVVVIAHNGAGNATISSPDKITFANNKCTDTFYYYGDVNVSGGGTYVLNLKRCVSMFRMKITENMPSDIKQMQFYYTGGSSTFSAVTGYGCVNSRQTETIDVTSSMVGGPTTFEVYTFPHDNEGTLNMKVSALAADGTPQREATYTIPVTIRKITEFTTPYFQGTSSPNTSSFSLTIDNDGQWEGLVSM